MKTILIRLSIFLGLTLLFIVLFFTFFVKSVMIHSDSPPGFTTILALRNPFVFEKRLPDVANLSRRVKKLGYIEPLKQLPRKVDDRFYVFFFGKKKYQIEKTYLRNSANYDETVIAVLNTNINNLEPIDKEKLSGSDHLKIVLYGQPPAQQKLNITLNDGHFFYRSEIFNAYNILALNDFVYMYSDDLKDYFSDNGGTISIECEAIHSSENDPSCVAYQKLPKSGIIAEMYFLKTSFQKFSKIYKDIDDFFNKRATPIAK